VHASDDDDDDDDANEKRTVRDDARERLSIDRGARRRLTFDASIDEYAPERPKYCYQCIIRKIRT